MNWGVTGTTDRAKSYTTSILSLLVRALNIHSIALIQCVEFFASIPELVVDALVGHQ